MSKAKCCAICHNLIPFGSPRVIFSRKNGIDYKHLYTKDCSNSPGVPGQELLKLRKSLKLSQRKAADLTNIPFSMFRNMEKSVAASDVVLKLKQIMPKAKKSRGSRKFSTELRSNIIEFGREIKSLRKAAGLTRSVFCKRVGISCDRLEGMERGLIKAPDEIRAKILELLSPKSKPIKISNPPQLVTISKVELDKYIEGYNNWISIANMVKKGI